MKGGSKNCLPLFKHLVQFVLVSFSANRLGHRGAEQKLRVV